MSSTSQPKPSRDRWNEIVVPTARGLKDFFWNLVWFALLVLALASSGNNSRSTVQGDGHNQHQPPATTR